MVRLHEGGILPCRIKGKFRMGELRLTNPVAVGDRVRVVPAPDEDGQVVGTIETILPRDNYVVRSSPRKRFHNHLLAANIDQALVMATIVQPNLKQGFIDRFLLMTEPYNIPTFIVFAKADLYGEEELAIFNYLKDTYEQIGYGVLLVSALSGQGLDEMKALLKDKLSLIGGHSGVGKSTLINALQPNLQLETGDLSDYSGKGQHTTTFAEMHPLDFGGDIIDTPGIKSLAFVNMNEEEVAHNFREFFALSGQCRFSNCKHINEPRCAVKEAVEKGELSELRYQNYAQILAEINDQNYWEQNREL
jgi:ribosome biogenesis GTPase